MLIEKERRKCRTRVLAEGTVLCSPMREWVMVCVEWEWSSNISDCGLILLWLLSFLQN